MLTPAPTPTFQINRKQSSTFRLGPSDVPQYIAKKTLLHCAGIDTGRLEHTTNGERAQLWGRQGRKGTIERSDGSATRRHNYAVTISQSIMNRRRN